MMMLHSLQSPLRPTAARHSRDARNLTARPQALPQRPAPLAKEEQPASRQLQASIAAAALSALLLAPGPALAGTERIAEFAASGLIFKDNVEVMALEDPEVSGVTLYFSDFKRSLADKLSKDFFTEPSQASVTCVATGPVVIKDIKRVEGFEGKEVFSEKKGLNFFTDKTLRVRRVYDAEHKALIYVSYSTRLTGASADGGVSTGRYRTSICALPLPPPPPPPPAPAAPAAEAAAATP